MSDSRAMGVLRLDQLRCRFAANRLEEGRFAPWESDRAHAKKYRSVVLNAGTYVRQVGLHHTLAFWTSKGGEHLEVLDDLLAWLASPENPLTAWLFASDAIGRKAWLARLRSLSFAELALVEREAEQILGWYKRLYEGWWKATHDNRTEQGDEASAS